MRYRLSVVDDAYGISSDLVVEADPATTIGDVLDLVGASLPAQGSAAVHGRPLDRVAPLADSPLRDGIVLRYGGAGDPAPDPYLDAANRTGLGLRVLSGPSAGATVELRDGRTVEIGRSSQNGLVLDDVDVSRRHAVVRGTGGVFAITDAGSANGTLVGGTRLTAPHTLREGEPVQLGASRIVLEDHGRSAAVLQRAADGAYLLNRRFPDRRSPFDAPQVTLPAPLQEDDPRGLPVLAMVLPLVLSVTMALVLRSPIYLLFGLLSPLMLAGNYVTDRKRRLARERRQQGSYGEKLVAAMARITAAVDDEDADLRQRMPDPGTVTRIATGLRRELWTRRPGHDDWLLLRAGVADRPASVDVTGELPADWTEPVLRRVPVGMDLEQLAVVGLAGPPAWVTARLAWVATQSAVLHSADELQIIVLAPNAREDGEGWMRWLPHSRTADGTVLGAWDDDDVDVIVRQLVEQLNQRAARSPAGRERVVGQTLVLMVGAGALVRRPTVVDLLARGPAHGLRFVCTDTDERLLPDSCRAVLVEAGGSTVLRIDRGAAVDVVPDELVGGAAEHVARTLAPLRRVGDAPAGGIPDAVRFTDLVDVPSEDALRALWRLAPERSDVVLGSDGDGPFAVDIARHGPHAVVAGTSGAGKSELLQTWVGALALANTPERLSVVFMDYKGGAAFRDLVALPHVVGTVTNLDARLAVRALSSLRAELTRRQQQLSAAGAGDRADYLRRAAADPALPPFPRLLVVVDELAELKDQLPALVEGLVGVARIGRSLGVHLVLATQKPAGVVDAQIRANVDLRMCLRTRDEGESIDVIEIGDAARIPKERPGRALVSRGGARPELVQTARISTPRASGAGQAPRVVPLRWSAQAAPPRPGGADGLATDLHAIVEVVAAAAVAEGLVAPFRPWTPPLPGVVVLDDLPANPRRLLIGLADRPSEQCQPPLELPLGSGHVGIVGSGRTGRTSALRAIAAGLARANAPTDVHVHVLDGTGALSGLVALPHVGVVATDDDPEQQERLLTRLADEVRRRRRALAEHGASTIEELGADAPPSIVVLVDDWRGVFEGEGAAQAALQDLLTGGAAAAGVTVCIAGDERMLRGRLLSRLDHRLSLRLNNPSDGTTLGLGVRNLPDGLPPGRALLVADGNEVQIPLLARDPVGPAQAAALSALATALRDRHGDDAGERAPMRLQPLPQRIGLTAADRLPDLVPGQVLLGVSGDRLSRVRTDLGDAVGHVIVAGPSRAGRSTAVASIAASAATGGHRTVLVAPRPGPPHRAAADRGVVLVTPADLAAVLDAGEVAVVAVDDADIGQLTDDVVGRLTGPGGPALVVAAQLDAFGFGARGLLQAAKKAAGPVVLLCPPNHLAADNVGVRIERGAAFSGPPGRAVLSVGGELLLGQVADLTAD